MVNSLKVLFIGVGFDVDEYVRRFYKFVYVEMLEVGLIVCLLEFFEFCDVSI